MNAITDIMPANNDKPCALCQRIHRKLYLTRGEWLGQNCARDFKLFMGFESARKVEFWGGDKNKFEKLQKLANAQKAP